MSLVARIGFVVEVGKVIICVSVVAFSRCCGNGIWTHEQLGGVSNAVGSALFELKTAI